MVVRSEWVYSEQLASPIMSAPDGRGRGSFQKDWKLTAC
jgi:hypothetical protein